MDLTFEESKARLEEIANLVEDPEMTLDEALTLYEEAVKIGLHACEVSESDILMDAAVEAPEEAASVTEAVAVEESVVGQDAGVMDADA